MSESDRSKKIYRIMNFHHVVQMFERNELYFSSPKVWDDPYEQRIKHPKSHALYAQCWCQGSTSDAMWRIYSQYGMGVQIITTVGKLEDAMEKAIKGTGYKRRLRAVHYKSEEDLEAEVESIVSSLRVNFNISRACDVLYLKRKAFNHESEWRATLFLPDADVRIENKLQGIIITVDGHELVDSILLDPRAPNELVEAFKYYLKESIGFEGDVGRSLLYKVPKQFEVEDNSVLVEHL